MREKIKLLTITPDKRDLKRIQDLHDKYVPDTYLCFKAKNEKEAVKILSEINPEIIVIELLNSKIDGIALINKIKQLSPHTKVFIYSYDDDPDVIDEYKAKGAYKYYIIPLLIDTYFHDLYVALNIE